MDKYLKMADVFDGRVNVKHIDSACIHELKYGDESGSNYTLQDDGFWMLARKEHAKYAAHAINMHDELVAEVDMLTSSLNHANSNHELFERQYYLEKDKCEDLQAEVERLRGENEALMKCRMAAREFFNCTVASGGLVKVSSANKAALDEADKAADWLEIELKATADLVKK